MPLQELGHALVELLPECPGLQRIDVQEIGSFDVEPVADEGCVFIELRLNEKL